MEFLLSRCRSLDGDTHHPRKLNIGSYFMFTALERIRRKIHMGWSGRKYNSTYCPKLRKCENRKCRCHAKPYSSSDFIGWFWKSADGRAWKPAPTKCDRTIKFYTTKRYREITGNQTNKLWQCGFYDRILRDEAEFQRAWEYIEYNALKEYGR